MFHNLRDWMLALVFVAIGDGGWVSRLTMKTHSAEPRHMNITGR